MNKVGTKGQGEILESEGGREGGGIVAFPGSSF